MLHIQYNIIMCVQAVCIEEQTGRHRVHIFAKVCRSYIQYSTRKCAYRHSSGFAAAE